MPYLEVSRWFWENYGTAIEKEVIGNTVELLNSWQSHKGMEALIVRYDLAQVYAFFAQHKMEDNILVTYFFRVINKTGEYVRAYDDWLARTEDLKTYVHLKDSWRKEHLKMKISNPTANSFDHGGSATKTGGTGEKMKSNNGWNNAQMQ